MSRCLTINFQLSIMSKWLAKHLSTKFSFKKTIRKRHVYIDIGWSWIWNLFFYLGIRSDDRTKMIVLPSFHLASRLNSQKKMKLSLLMNSYKVIYLWLLLFPIVIIEVSTSHKCCFWFYFSSLPDYLAPSTRNALVNTLWGEMERFKERAFQPLKMRKKKVSWNIKTKCVTTFYRLLGLRVWRIILVITWWAHKRQTFTLISIKIMRILKCFV